MALTEEEMEKRLFDALIKAGVAEELADRAFKMAQSALTRIEILERQDLKYSYAGPHKAIFGDAPVIQGPLPVNLDSKIPESSIQEVKPVKLSPFAVDKLMNKEEALKEEIWDMSMGE